MLVTFDCKNPRVDSHTTQRAMPMSPTPLPLKLRYSSDAKLSLWLQEASSSIAIPSTHNLFPVRSRDIRLGKFSNAFSQSGPFPQLPSSYRSSQDRWEIKDLSMPCGSSTFPPALIYCQLDRDFVSLANWYWISPTVWFLPLQHR